MTARYLTSVFLVKLVWCVNQEVDFGGKEWSEALKSLVLSCWG